ncbi:MAG: UDP-N-acetylglucosamine 2-epimerase (non-hydrolyzing) [Candidatus Hydrogenedentes bacterium]|nr:UDP-N-acetylglucosamine 2-epimerase (non-hydrolyzing) [Candidatus Hydrogenedentota bacterium]
MGTRPEIIKMAPVYHALRAHGAFRTEVCLTGQHRELADSMMSFFEVPADRNLDVMTRGQGLSELTSRVLLGMSDALRSSRPDLLLVQGDTTTVMASALAAFYLGIPVGHVEAGLRTWNLRNPFPEELNRWVADAVSTLHFAPTPAARDALVRNGITAESVTVTGNTVIDALFLTLRKLQGQPFKALNLAEMPRMLLLTTHRRESFGDPMRNTFRAISALIQKYPDLHVVFPVHPNPNVQEAMTAALVADDRVHLLPPQSYPEFVKLMRDSHLILTDSGGVQEEAPSLGKPVLVLRETTERPEGVSAGTAKLVGTASDQIVREASRLLEEPRAYARMATAVNPYGDGQASGRIVETISQYLLDDS